MSDTSFLAHQIHNIAPYRPTC